MQLKGESLSGAFIKSVLTDPYQSDADPLRHRVTGEVRIDFAQHALSALLEYRRQTLAREAC